MQNDANILRQGILFFDLAIYRHATRSSSSATQRSNNAKLCTSSAKRHSSNTTLRNSSSIARHVTKPQSDATQQQRDATQQQLLFHHLFFALSNFNCILFTNKFEKYMSFFISIKLKFSSSICYLYTYVI